jgi:hypothetical protein
MLVPPISLKGLAFQAIEHWLCCSWEACEEVVLVARREMKKIYIKCADKGERLE